MRFPISWIGIILLGVGCNRTEPSPPADSVVSAVASSSLVAPPAATTATGTLDQVAVPEDFEEKAKQAVTAETLDSELDTLEKSINAGK